MKTSDVVIETLLDVTIDLFIPKFMQIVRVLEFISTPRDLQRKSQENRANRRNQKRKISPDNARQVSVVF